MIADVVMIVAAVVAVTVIDSWLVVTTLTCAVIQALNQPQFIRGTPFKGGNEFFWRGEAKNIILLGRQLLTLYYAYRKIIATKMVFVRLFLVRGGATRKFWGIRLSPGYPLP